MRIKNLFLLPALIASLALMSAGRVTAQTFTTLHNFTNGIDGASLQAGLVLSGNVLYGTTEYGGSTGGSTLFAVNANGSGFRIVYNFSPETANNLGFNTNSDAGGSDGTLVLSGNTLYGASYDGGTNGTGAVFAVNTNGTFTTLHTLSAGKTNTVTGLFTNSDGYGAEAGMILSGNTLYGTTEHGGKNGWGVVFKVNTNGTGFVSLYNFTNGTDGSIPHTLVISGSTLYGTTLGYSGNGTVFALNTNGTGFTTLHSFTATNFTLPQGGPGPAPGYTNTDGVAPSGLALYGFTLYGTAVLGGTNGNGTVFALNTNGTGFTTLHSFAASKTNSSGIWTNSEGGHPIEFGGLILSSNTLYGTAYWDGISGNGTVFAVNTNGTGFTNLHNFTATLSDSFGDNTNSDGANPYAGLTLSSNTLYGTADNGGTSGDGTVFSIYLGLAVTTTSLPNGTNGEVYNQTLTATGGQKPYTWTNISGALPPGLNLSTNGVISGTPTNSGIFNFTVEATDALSSTATQVLALTVFGPPNIVLQPTNNSVAVGNNVNLMVSVTGIGPFSYQWQLNGTNIPDGIITTVAGGGFNNSRNGIVATNAELYSPVGVAADTIGNLFIADENSDSILKVGTNGIISTVAGGGPSGYSGDGGAATNAELDSPAGVAVDANGNLYIADSNNRRIRKAGTNGIIITVAGNGTNGYSGDGGVATNAEFENPSSVAVDAIGNLYIADESYAGANVIRQVGTNGIITTVAGNKTYGYSGDGGAATNAELLYPNGPTVDANGNLFIADAGNNRIRKVGTNGIITTVAGNGTGGYFGDNGVATNAELNYPSGVAVDANGNLFIADQNNEVVRKVGTNGIITTVAGNGYYTNEYSIAFGYQIIGGFSGDGGAATNAELYSPSDVALDTTGNLFIADSNNNRIRKVVNPGIPGPTLGLADVGSGNVGAYDVVVSNPYGSVTSSVVNVSIVVSAPIFQSAKLNNGQFMLTWSAVSNGVYQLQYKTNLLQTNWINIGSTITASNTVLSATNTINTDSQRFYRVQQQ